MQKKSGLLNVQAEAAGLALCPPALQNVRGCHGVAV